MMNLLDNEVEEQYVTIKCLRQLTNENSADSAVDVVYFRELQIQEKSVLTVDSTNNASDGSLETTNKQSTYNFNVGDIIFSHLTGTPSFLFLCVSHVNTAKCDVFIHGSNVSNNFFNYL